MPRPSFRLGRGGAALVLRSAVVSQTAQAPGMFQQVATAARPGPPLGGKFQSACGRPVPAPCPRRRRMSWTRRSSTTRQAPRCSRTGWWACRSTRLATIWPLCAGPHPARPGSTLTTLGRRLWAHGRACCSGAGDRAAPGGPARSCMRLRSLCECFTGRGPRRCRLAGEIEPCPACWWPRGRPCFTHCHQRTDLKRLPAVRICPLGVKSVLVVALVVRVGSKCPQQMTSAEASVVSPQKAHLATCSSHVSVGYL